MNLSSEIRGLLADGLAWSIGGLLDRLDERIEAIDALDCYERIFRSGNVGQLTQADAESYGRRRLIQEAANKLVSAGVLEAAGRGDSRTWKLRGTDSMEKEFREIELSKLDDHETQVRIGICEETAADYAAAEKDGDELPPVIVYEDGKGLLWLADGFHRVEARKLNGETTVNSEVRKGTKADAIRFACSANAKHGKRLTAADKERAVRLFAATFPKASVHEAAKACRVSWFFAERILKPVQNAEKVERYNERKALAREPEPSVVSRADSGADMRPALAREPRSEKPKEAIPVFDGKGKQVPDKLRDVFAANWHQETIDQLERLAMAAQSVCQWNPFLDPRITDAIDAIKDQLSNAKPFCVCKCNGDGCDTCMMTGFVPEFVVRNQELEAAA